MTPLMATSAGARSGCEATRDYTVRTLTRIISSTPRVFPGGGSKARRTANGSVLGKQRNAAAAHCRGSARSRASRQDARGGRV